MASTVVARTFLGAQAKTVRKATSMRRTVKVNALHVSCFEICNHRCAGWRALSLRDARIRARYPASPRSYRALGRDPCPRSTPEAL